LPYLDAQRITIDLHRNDSTSLLLHLYLQDDSFFYTGNLKKPLPASIQWLRDVMFFLKLEKIQYSLRGVSKFYSKWQQFYPFLSLSLHYPLIDGSVCCSSAVALVGTIISLQNKANKTDNNTQMYII